MNRRRTDAEHYTQAQETYALYQHIGGQNSQWPGWAATLLFYTAVQEVEAALRHLGEHPSSDHHDRKLKIQSRLPTPLLGAYTSLQSLSQDARYNGYKPSQSRLVTAELALNVVRTEIQQVAPPPY